MCTVLPIVARAAASASFLDTGKPKDWKPESGVSMVVPTLCPDSGVPMVVPTFQKLTLRSPNFQLYFRPFIALFAGGWGGSYVRLRQGMVPTIIRGVGGSNNYSTQML